MLANTTVTGGNVSLHSSREKTKEGEQCRCRKPQSTVIVKVITHRSVVEEFIKGCVTTRHHQDKHAACGSWTMQWASTMMSKVNDLDSSQRQPRIIKVKENTWLEPESKANTQNRQETGGGDQEALV